MGGQLGHGATEGRSLDLDGEDGRHGVTGPGPKLKAVENRQLGVAAVQPEGDAQGVAEADAADFQREQVGWFERYVRAAGRVALTHANRAGVVMAWNNPVTTAAVAAEDAFDLVSAGLEAKQLEGGKLREELASPVGFSGDQAG